MTGVWALRLAMRLCPNGVNLFGFTDASNLQRSRRAPYHYFDEQLYARNGTFRVMAPRARSQNWRGYSRSAYAFGTQAEEQSHSYGVGITGISNK